MKKKISLLILLVLISLFSACLSKYNNQNINNETITLKYQPMQCQETPWDKWLKTSEIRWVKEPTEKEVITAYLSNAFNIELIDFQIKEINKIVCQACDVCPTTYYYVINVKNQDADKLKKQGWA